MIHSSLGCTNVAMANELADMYGNIKKVGDNLDDISTDADCLNSPDCELNSVASFNIRHEEVLEVDSNSVTLDQALTTASDDLIEVYVNGLLLHTNEYDFDGTIIQFSSTLSAGDTVVVVGRKEFTVADTYSKNEIDAKVGSVYVGSGWEGIVSVKDYGAVGDGVTDDTQAFVDAAAASNTVYVPKGLYNITGPIGTDSHKWIAYEATNNTGNGYLDLNGIVEVFAFNRDNKVVSHSSPDTPFVTFNSKDFDHTGGTHGFVSSVQFNTATAGADTTDFIWTSISQINNNSNAGENVAVYGQAHKNANGPTWAGCFDIIDHTDTPIAGSIGIEITCTANGADINNSRNALHVSLNQGLDNGQNNQWGRCIYLTGGPTAYTNYGIFGGVPFADSFIYNGVDSSSTSAISALIRDNGMSNLGIDLTGAGYVTGTAIRLAAGHRISFDAQDSNYIVYNNAGNALNIVAPLAFHGEVKFAGIHGHTAATAVAGGGETLPSNVSGYLVVTVDGTPVKIPYFL